MALLAAAVAAAVVVALVVGRDDGGGSGDSAKNGEIFLQAANRTGPDPFTESSARESSAAPASLAPAESAPANAVRSVDGGTAGLYGGTRNVAACDVELQIRTLQAKPDVNRAFASVAGVSPEGVPDYLRSLTPVQLRMDTRVTNHGYRDGRATAYQSVLQAGTAVLVDAHGVPRVRCACGNPLTPPVAQSGATRTSGDAWPSYSSSNVVVVAPSTTVINVFVIHDSDGKGWIARHRGDHHGKKDKPTKPPVDPSSPSASVTTPTAPPSSPSDSPSTPQPCVSSGDATPPDKKRDGADTTPSTCPPSDDATDTTTGPGTTEPPKDDDSSSPSPPAPPEDETVSDSASADVSGSDSPSAAASSASGSPSASASASASVSGSAPVSASSSPPAL